MTNAIDIFNDFATNADAEQAGVWVPYAGDVEFLVARAGNKKYSRLFLKEYKAAERVLATKGPTAEAKATELNISVAAQTLLLGWKGDLNFKGEKLEYSLENAKKLLAVPDFYRWVMVQTEDMAKFKVVQDADDLGK